jgi:hypothetical protein
MIIISFANRLILLGFGLVVINNRMMSGAIIKDLESIDRIKPRGRMGALLLTFTVKIIDY